MPTLALVDVMRACWGMLIDTLITTSPNDCGVLLRMATPRWIGNIDSSEVDVKDEDDEDEEDEEVDDDDDDEELDDDDDELLLLLLLLLLDSTLRLRLSKQK